MRIRYHILIINLFCNAIFLVNAQSDTIDFEELNLPTTNSYWNGEDFNGFFQSHEAQFLNYYDTSGGIGYWSGFSYSNMTDTLTQGFLNEYSAMAMSHTQYAIGYQPYFEPFKIDLDSVTKAQVNTQIIARSAKFTNNAYAYYSMKNGDGVAKKFGDSLDANGQEDATEGKDWYKITIFGSDIQGNINVADSVEFYLADFRDSTNQYIVRDWQKVTFSNGLVFPLHFKLSSSDNSQWGMNTPAYFAMDDLVYETITNISSVSEKKENRISLEIYPNPAKDQLNLTLHGISKSYTTKIFDLSGNTVYTSSQYNQTIDVGEFANGVYIIQIQWDNSILSKRFVKQ